jgi:hypothetical protein
LELELVVFEMVHASFDVVAQQCSMVLTAVVFEV